MFGLGYELHKDHKGYEMENELFLVKDE